MTNVFDGKKIALEKAALLKPKIAQIVSRINRKPTLAAVAIGEGNQNKYLALKSKFFEDLGAEVILFNFEMGKPLEYYKSQINELNNDKAIDGVMIQLPINTNLSDLQKEDLIETISREKDIDGMVEDSKYTTPVVAACLVALNDAFNYISLNVKPKILVLGSKGFVGQRLLNTIKDSMKVKPFLKEDKFDIFGVDTKEGALATKISDADIIISATGVGGIVKPAMVKEDFAAIDVGAPLPEFDRSTHEKAIFITPVPGGIGPLTIYYLLENLVKAAELNS